MKMTKKKVFALALSLCILATLSLSTLAWFSDTDRVDNNFLIADSDDDEEDIFSIDVYEEDANGYRYDVGINYEYTDVLPGKTLAKKVFVENTCDYNQYVRVFVTVSDVTHWLDVLGLASTNVAYDLTEMFVVPADFDTTWVRNDAETAYNPAADTLTYVYYYNSVLAPDAVVSFMEAFKVPETLETSDVVAMDGAFEIDVVAGAIQSDYILETSSGNHAQDAMAAFDKID